ncbi:MAG TPA: glycosyltransferase [Steroidobacteraceae bacterium]|nr:glycosyltransferase [Steroidobacteraceae bacterium]
MEFIGDGRTPTVVVLSHLRYDFVYQRPQQLMSRLAERHPVLFVEEPVRIDGPPRLRVWQPAANVHVLEPQTPLAAAGFHDEQVPMLRELLDPVLARLERPVLWFYTPMALPLVADAEAGLVVYDCMDELSAFRFAPKQLQQREAALFRRADVVFTGGRSLYRAKRDRHPDVWCFPSCVDVRHFARGEDGSDPWPHLPRPRLGYYGVIDERLDYALLDRVACERPDWQLFMVGPFAKVDPADVPHRPNLHWLGQQAFETLPRFVASWDVCLMPFVLNEATRHISPTKTLEYMAAGKPIVSTRVRDVAEPYGHLVQIADHWAQFVELCEAAMQETPLQRAGRARQMRDLAHDQCWDDTVAAMERIVFARAGAPGSARPSRVEEVTLQLDDEGRVREAHGRREVLRIEPQARRLRLAAGAVLGYCDLFAAIPLPRLVELLGDDAPRGVRAAAAELRELRRHEAGQRRDGRATAARAIASRSGADDDTERFARNVVRIQNWLATQDIHPAASDFGDGRRDSTDAATHRVHLAR